MTDPELNLLAALFARSNMGHELVPPLFRDLPQTVSEAVSQTCVDLIENDEHYDLFMEEAAAWRKSLASEEVRERYRKSSPHVFKAAGL